MNIRRLGILYRFGYLEFSGMSKASKALKNLNGADVGGRTIKLDYANPRGGGGDRGGYGECV